MAVTAAVREVLAMSAGAKAGFGLSADELGQELLEIAVHRAGVGRLPEDEDLPYGRMYAQQKRFEAFGEHLATLLGPIDAKAGEVMTALSLGRSEAAAY